MSRTLRISAIGLALCALPAFAACEKTPEPGASATPAKSSAPAAPVSVAAAAPTLSDDDVPVPEDFIEEATKDIGEKDYKSHIDAIEKEIDSPDE